MAFAVSLSVLGTLFRTYRVRVVLAIPSKSVAYDGRWHEFPEITGTTDDGRVEVVGSDERTYTISGLTTDGVGILPSDSVERVEATGSPVVTDEHGNDVTDSVDLDIDAGSFEILPREVVIRSADLSREFDGHALVCEDDASVEVSGLVDGDELGVVYTGSQLYVGSSPNSFDVIWGSGTDASKYSVRKVEGTLTVTDRKDDKIDLVVEGATERVPFDGEEHVFDASDPGEVHVEADGVGYVVTGVSCEGTKGTAAGTYRSRVKRASGSAVYLEDDVSREHDVSDQVRVKCQDGSLVVEKGDLFVATFFGSDYDWTDSVYVSDDCETFHKVSEVPSDQRDPCIIWRDGRFWVITSFNEQDGHLWFNVSSSSDLVHWTSPSKCGPYGLDSLPNDGLSDFDVVAPEWFLDDDGSLYVIVSCGWWGANHGSPTDDHMQSYLLKVSNLSCDGDACALVVDGEAKKMSVNEDGADRIDGTINHVGDSYYLTIKRDGLFMEQWRNDSATAGGWSRVNDKCLYGFEAPCVVSFGRTWRMFADGVPDVEPYGTRQWSSDAVDGNWEERPLKLFDGDDEVKDVRHGTVLRVSKRGTPDGWAAIDELVRSVAQRET